MKKQLVAAALCVFVLAAPVPAGASESGTSVPPHYNWPHDGPFGQYDRAALQRGFQVYRESCAACHSLKLLSYRNLEDIGFTEEQVKDIAAQYLVDDVDDAGEVFQRPARPSDRFVPPFANEQQARNANNGALPPDMSLIAKARPHGEDYIVALMTGYEEAPAGVEMMPGMNYNKYFPGGQIAMAPPLSDGQIVYPDGREATVQQAARDVAQFLAWAAEPHMVERKQMGLKVLIFLFVFSVLLYLSKRKLWSDVH